MKKVIMVLFLATVVLGLSACGDAVKIQDWPPQTTEAEQGVGGASSDNAETSANQTANQQGLPQEQIAGSLQAIDGTKLTIDASTVFVANGTGPHYASGEPTEKQEANIRLTEETAIEVRTTAGGQITSSRAGTMDDLSLQDTVLAEGEWQGDEYVVTKLTVFKLK